MNHPGQRRFGMKRPLFFFVLISILAIYPIESSAEKAPHKIAGFVLGDKIANHAELVRMETALPLRDQRYLRVVQTKDLDGFKSGTIAFGECTDPGKILRIKLKYEFSGRKFYDELLERFKQRFGEPDEWRGDPFHVIIAWKWSFRDKDNNNISLILQHSRDEDYKWGNSVKLTNTTLIAKEHSCYAEKHPESTDSHRGKKARKVKLKDIDFHRLVPE
jgi:hypothetical protein